MQKWAELEVAHYHLKRKALTPVIKNGTVEPLCKKSIKIASNDLFNSSSSQTGVGSISAPET